MAIGYVHIDISELRLANGKLNMFLAIDRVSKFTYVEFRSDAGKANGADFLRGVVAAFPYAIHTVLTDNGMAFADLPKNRGRYPEIVAIFGGHIFDRVCKDHVIEHKLTKPYHPWTNGQAERMNRTVKEATIKVFHYPDLESLKAHVLAFVPAYNSAKHLSPELNPMENVWDYLRQNKLCALVWDSYDAIVDACKAACKAAWKWLIADPKRVTSIGTREWACVCL